MVYQRIGVKAPSSHSLNPAWLPVDTSRVGSTFITIAAGPKDFMVSYVGVRPLSVTLIISYVGVEAPFSHSLNPASLPVDTSRVGSTFINIAAGPKDFMVSYVGVKAPSSHSLNPASLPVDTSRVGSTFINIAAGPKDFMVSYVVVKVPSFHSHCELCWNYGPVFSLLGVKVPSSHFHGE